MYAEDDFTLEREKNAVEEAEKKKCVFSFTVAVIPLVSCCRRLGPLTSVGILIKR